MINPIATFADLFVKLIVSPRGLFENVKLHPNWLTPLIFLGILTLVVTPYIASHPTVIDPPDTNGMSSFEWNPSSNFILGMTVWAMVQLFGSTLILAGYFRLTARSASQTIRFSHWFTLTLWAKMTVLISIATSLISSATSSDILQKIVHPMLWFSLEDLGIYSGLLIVAKVEGILCILLMTIGHHVYTGRTKLVSLLIVLVPYVVFTAIVIGSIELFGEMFQQ